MATITMDASEYEALKKNIQLLEEAAVREQKLNDQIAELQNEVIQSLLDAEKSVSMIKQTHVIEHVALKKDINTTFSQLERLFGRYSGPFNHMSDREKIEAAINAFFTITTTKTVQDQSIVTKGFDEVRAEFEAKYQAELDADTKKALASIPELESKVQELQKQNFTSNIAEISLEKLQFDYDRLKESNADLTMEHSGLKTRLRLLVGSGWNIFNYLEKHRELSKLVGLGKRYE